MVAFVNLLLKKMVVVVVMMVRDRVKDMDRIRADLNLIYLRLLSTKTYHISYGGP